MFEIIDNNGVIHSGSESEMLLAWAIMTGNDEDLELTKKALKQYREEYKVDSWDGDIKLIQVIDIYN